MRAFFLVAVMVLSACAHAPLSNQDLESFSKPAFIVHVDKGAGPRSTVFRDDAKSYGDRAKALDDKGLATRLEKGSDGERSMNRYQLADSLRAQVLSELPKARPWKNSAPPTQVAAALESFLVEEVRASGPDVSRLAPLGVDAVVEIVIEDYGLRSEGGKAGVFLYGNARLYRLSGATLYRRAFFSDEVKAGLAVLDPFEVEAHPAKFTGQLKGVLEAVAHQLALDLTAQATK